EPNGHEAEDDAVKDGLGEARHTGSPLSSSQRFVSARDGTSPMETFGEKPECASFSCKRCRTSNWTPAGPASSIAPVGSPTLGGCPARFGEGFWKAKFVGSTLGKPSTGARLSLWGSGWRTDYAAFRCSRNVAMTDSILSLFARKTSAGVRHGQVPN